MSARINRLALAVCAVVLFASLALAGSGVPRLESATAARITAGLELPRPAPCAAGRQRRLPAHRGRTCATSSRGRFRFFSPASFWNTPLPDLAQLDPGSPRLVGALEAEIGAEQAVRSGPWIATTRYSVPIYTVGPEQPTVRVRLVAETPSPLLQSAFEQVPLPADALPAAGTDAHLVVWQPSSDSLWEFWKLARTTTGPQANWGGAMRDVSSNPGVYGPEAWPGAEPWWGASASSLPLTGGLITLEDLRAGEIDHALALAVPDVRAGVYAAPARRGDGRSASPLALPEGAHLRLDPDLDIASLDLPRTTRLIAEAAQRYGIFIRDGASVTQFFAQDPVTATRNPYAGVDGYFEGRYPNQLLATFPWDHLRLLKMELHPDE